MGTSRKYRIGDTVVVKKRDSKERFDVEYLDAMAKHELQVTKIAGISTDSEGNVTYRLSVDRGWEWSEDMLDPYVESKTNHEELKRDVKEFASCVSSHIASNWKTYAVATATAVLLHIAYSAYSYLTSDEYLTKKNVEVADSIIETASGEIFRLRSELYDSETVKRNAEECRSLNLSGSVTDCESYGSSESAKSVFDTANAE